MNTLVTAKSENSIVFKALALIPMLAAVPWAVTIVLLGTVTVRLLVVSANVVAVVSFASVTLPAPVPKKTIEIS